MFQAEKIALIGHRGVGKSTTPQELSEFFPHYLCFDLDKEIEKQTRKSVFQIFHELGETGFRNLEVRVYEELVNQSGRVLISVGGGFRVRAFTDEVFVIWVRRQSDQWGRIFLDRPRLDLNCTPLQEFQIRRQKREPAFHARADLILQIPEGHFYNNLSKLVFPSEAKKTAYMPLTDWHFERNHRFSFLGTVQYLGYELRTDLMSEENFLKGIEILKDKSLIISFRNGFSKNTFAQVKALMESKKRNNVIVDWDAELQEKAPTWVGMISNHSQNPDLFKNFSSEQTWKWSPEIENFEQLQSLHSWWLEDFQNRNIFPRGKGRWKWFRLLQGTLQQIIFLDNGVASVPDQPNLLEWLSFSKSKSFGAVLGSPEDHSYSPSFHRSFSQKLNSNFLAIEVLPKEFPLAMDFLNKMGLKFAAVTSPLKLPASDWLNSAQEAVNTLYKNSQGQWQGLNTDPVGFQRLLDFLKPNQKVAVWGGGGTLPLMQSFLPHADFYSVRTEKIRNLSEKEYLKSDTKDSDKGNQGPKYDVVIWAASPNASHPPFKDVQLVVDLNYREDSQARSFAIKQRCRYIDGLQMFLFQAREQQKVWEAQVER